MKTLREEIIQEKWEKEFDQIFIVQAFNDLPRISMDADTPREIKNFIRKEKDTSYMRGYKHGKRGDSPTFRTVKELKEWFEKEILKENEKSI